MKKGILSFIMLVVSLASYAPATVKPIDSRYWPMILPDSVIDQLRVSYLRNILNRAVMILEYWAHDGLTFCNVLARDVLDSRPHAYWGSQYGFKVDAFPLDVSSVFPTAFSILRLSIRDAWYAADRAWRSGKIERLSREQAQAAANRGEVVWVISLRWMHEAIVYPGRYCPDMGCMIAQAGGVGCTGIMRLYDHRAFGWRRDDIRFYKFPIRRVE